MKRLVLALAVLGAAAPAAFAQTYPTHPPRGPVGVDQDGYLRDSRGNIIDRNANRVIGSNTAHPGPGDYGMPASPGPSASVPFGVPQPSISAQPPQLGEAVPANRNPAMRDEYGFKYDSRGNRIDARGNIISPQTR
jgi:hypothetical protein